MTPSSIKKGAVGIGEVRPTCWRSIPDFTILQEKLEKSQVGRGRPKLDHLLMLDAARLVLAVTGTPLGNAMLRALLRIANNMPWWNRRRDPGGVDSTLRAYVSARVEAASATRQTGAIHQLQRDTQAARRTQW